MQDGTFNWGYLTTLTVWSWFKNPQSPIVSNIFNRDFNQNVLLSGTPPPPSQPINQPTGTPKILKETSPLVYRYSSFVQCIQLAAVCEHSGSGLYSPVYSPEPLYLHSAAFSFSFKNIYTYFFSFKVTKVTTKSYWGYY